MQARLPRADDDSHVASRFEQALAAFFRVDRDLAATRARFLSAIEDFPKLRGPLEAVAASIRRLQRISDRLRMVEDPERFPEQADLAPAYAIRDWDERGWFVYNTLREVAGRTQPAVLQALDTLQTAGHVTAVQPYWIVNLVVVHAHPVAFRDHARVLFRGAAVIDGV